MWNAVNNQRVGHGVPPSKAELKSLLISALFALQKLPHKIRSFFQHPDTRYALGEAQ